MADEIKKTIELLDAFVPYINFSIEDKMILQFASDWSFAGFDPNVTLGQLKMNFAIWYSTHKDAPGVTKIPVKELFKNFVLAAVTVFCVRGSKISVIIDRTEDEKKPELTRLKDALVIIDTDPSKKLKKTDVTLARIAACFPDTAVRINCVPGVLRFVAEDSGSVDQIGFPIVYCTTVAAAAVPDSIYDKWLAWAKSYDKVVNPGKANAAKVEKYAAITRGASKLSAKDKDELYAFAFSRDTLVRANLGQLQAVAAKEGVTKAAPKKTGTTSASTRATV